MALKVDAKVPQTYDEIKNELKGDKGFCAVLAIAAITQLPVAEVAACLAKHGRKFRQGTSRLTQMNALEDLGYKLRQLTFKERMEIIQSYPGRHRHLSTITTHHPRRFPSAWAGMPDCLLFSTGHVSAFIGGQVVDWAIKHSKQVNEIWIVTKEEKQPVGQMTGWPAEEQAA